MAVFGAQVVVSLIFLSFLQKLCPIYSLGRWLLTRQGLVRYLHPTDDELKALSGNGQRSANGKKSRKTVNKGVQQNSTESFQVSRSVELHLSHAPLTPFDILPLRFYSEFIWVMDFTLTTAFVVTLTYIHEHFLSPHTNEYGLSSLWCFLLMLFSLKPLINIVSSYKISQNSGEVVLCCIFGFFFLISAMIILIIDDKTLEFHLVSAHDSFTESANQFLSKRELSVIGDGSLVTFRMVLAFISALVGALLTFPGVRVAKCHLDSLLIARDRPLLQMIMYADLLFPVFILSLWVPPISRTPLLGKVIPGTAVEISDSLFDLFRDVTIVSFIIVRMVLLRHRLQAYLNTACTKLEAIRKEAGKIYNTEIQGIVTQVFYYLCVVAVQLICPLTLIAATLLMNRSFTSANVAASPPAAAANVTDADSESLVNSVRANIQEFSLSLSELRSVFSSNLLQSVTSYFIWFFMYAWTVTTYFGIFYHTYLVRA
ncbi:TMEM161B [Bugula neritina]|uniref:TMEM161B n=1 Tax=Bugula neritina TaxID=10212 RepID=A0A7J7KIH1_BUGNE|nr:TMEM161B [Bugula neritina]